MAPVVDITVRAVVVRILYRANVCLNASSEISLVCESSFLYAEHLAKEQFEHRTSGPRSEGANYFIINAIITYQNLLK